MIPRQSEQTSQWNTGSNQKYKYHMEVDMVADMEVDMVATMVADIVADMEVKMMANM